MIFILSECFSVPIEKLAYLGFEVIYTNLLYGSLRQFRTYIEKKPVSAYLLVKKQKLTP